MAKKDDLIIINPMGFELDWTKVMPSDFNNLVMYLGPQIAIHFQKIWSEKEDMTFSIGKFMEENEDIDCIDFSQRLIDFIPFKMARVNRTFDKKRPSIFFDEEEIEILAGVFKANKFTAVVNVFIGGESVMLKDMPNKYFNIVRDLLLRYNAVSLLDVKEYRRYSKYMDRKNKKERRPEDMSKGQIVTKLILGAVAATIAVAAGAAGFSLFKDGFEGLTSDLFKDSILEVVDEE